MAGLQGFNSHGGSILSEWGLAGNSETTFHLSKAAVKYEHTHMAHYLVDIFREGICHNICLDRPRADQGHSNIMFIYLHPQGVEITLETVTKGVNIREDIAIY